MSLPDLQCRHEVLVLARPRPRLAAAADLHLPPAPHLGLRHRGHCGHAQGSVEGGLGTRYIRLEEGNLWEEWRTSNLE